MESSCLFDKHVVVFHNPEEFVPADFYISVLQLVLDVQIHFSAAVSWLFLTYWFNKF